MAGGAVVRLGDLKAGTQVTLRGIIVDDNGTNMTVYFDGKDGESGVCWGSTDSIDAEVTYPPDPGMLARAIAVSREQSGRAAVEKYKKAVKEGKA